MVGDWCDIVGCLLSLSRYWIYFGFSLPMREACLASSQVPSRAARLLAVSAPSLKRRQLYWLTNVKRMLVVINGPILE